MIGDDAEDRIDVDRGLRAKALLENEILAEAWTVLDRRLWERFREIPARDAEAREYVHKLVRVMRDFRGYFEEVVHKGEDASARIRDRERQSSINWLRR